MPVTPVLNKKGYCNKTCSVRQNIFLHLHCLNHTGTVIKTKNIHSPLNTGTGLRALFTR